MKWSGRNFIPERDKDGKNTPTLYMVCDCEKGAILTNPILGHYSLECDLLCPVCGSITHIRVEAVNVISKPVYDGNDNRTERTLMLPEPGDTGERHHAD